MKFLLKVTEKIILFHLYLTLFFSNPILASFRYGLTVYCWTTFSSKITLFHFLYFYLFLNVFILSIVFLFEKTKNWIYSLFGYDLITSIIGNAPLSSGKAGGLVALVSAAGGAIYNAYSAQKNKEHINSRIQSSEEIRKSQLELGQKLFPGKPTPELRAYNRQVDQNYAAAQENIRNISRYGDISDAFFGALGVANRALDTEVDLARAETNQRIATEVGSTVREGMNVVRNVTPWSIFSNTSRDQSNRDTNQGNTSDS